MGRVLKNYEVYKDKILAYLEATEITLEYRTEPGDGKYIPSARKIVIDPDLDESTEIAALLHEIGHTLDDSLHSKKTEKKLDNAYKAFYAERATEAQSSMVIQCERHAWTFARATAKRLRIRLGKWFDDEEKSALQTYGESSEEQKTGA